MDDRISDLMKAFEPATREQWRALVERGLKGAPFSGLTSRTADGLDIAPLYAEGDGAPAGALRSDRPAGRWDIRAVIAHPDPVQANAQAIEDLEGGANSLILKIDPRGETGVGAGSADDIARVLDGVLLEVATVALDAGFLGPQAADWLGAAAKGSPAAKLALHLDPIGALAQTGASPGPVESHIISAASVAARLAGTYPEASLFLASGRAVHEAGGSEAQELGFMAACAVAYAKALVRAGLPMDKALARIVLGVSVDGDYFLSIAKTRAARLIWDRIAAACLPGASAPAARIEARSSARMLSRLDAWTNLLRLTAAGFAGGTGGADAVALAPFTEPFGAPTSLARRQARNTQLVLIQEAALGRVADPAAGSWFVEAMTAELAREGWEVFRAIEAQGGAVAALASGFVAANVEGARAAAQNAAAYAHPGQVGVSRFPDLAETQVPFETLDPRPVAAQPQVRLPGPDSTCPALTPIRVSEPYEALRAAAAGLGDAARAQIVTLGANRDFAARAQFTANLLAAGGLAAETAAIDAAKAGPIAVLASSDALYESEGVAAVRRLKDLGVGQVVVAGRPDKLDLLRQAGADGFIFAGGDVVQSLRTLLTHLGGRP